MLDGGNVTQTKINYTGQKLDTTGLLNYNARLYDPVVGRFVSPDSIVPNMAIPQSLDRYSYAYNSPIIHNDPTGHMPPPPPHMPPPPLGGGYYGITPPKWYNNEESNARWDPLNSQLDKIPSVAQLRTRSSQGYAQHLTTGDLVGARIEMLSGVKQGGSHWKEVSDAFNGLMHREASLYARLHGPGRDLLSGADKAYLQSEYSQGLRALAKTDIFMLDGNGRYNTDLEIEEATLEARMGVLQAEFNEYLWYVRMVNGDPLQDPDPAESEDPGPPSEEAPPDTDYPPDFIGPGEYDDEGSSRAHSV